MRVRLDQHIDELDEERREHADNGEYMEAVERQGAIKALERVRDELTDEHHQRGKS